MLKCSFLLYFHVQMHLIGCFAYVYADVRICVI